MKLSTWILSISLLIPTLSFSQTTLIKFPKITKDSLIVITPLQLKKTNLIFVEHCKMKKEIPLLQDKINLNDSLINVLSTSNNFKTEQVLLLKKSVKTQDETINNLNKDLLKCTKKRKQFKKMSFCGISISLILGTLLILK